VYNQLESDVDSGLVSRSVLCFRSPSRHRLIMHHIGCRHNGDASAHIVLPPRAGSGLFLHISTVLLPSNVFDTRLVRDSQQPTLMWNLLPTTHT